MRILIWQAAAARGGGNSVDATARRHCAALGSNRRLNLFCDSCQEAPVGVLGLRNGTARSLYFTPPRGWLRSAPSCSLTTPLSDSLLHFKPTRRETMRELAAPLCDVPALPASWPCNLTVDNCTIQTPHVRIGMLDLTYGTGKLHRHQLSYLFDYFFVGFTLHAKLYAIIILCFNFFCIVII